MAEYIKFILIQKKPKTNIYNVKNIDSGHTLGIIKWAGAWRQYCFFPFGNTRYDRKCLTEIIKFIQKLMDDRK